MWRAIPVSRRREWFMYSSLSSERTIETENNFEYSRPHGYCSDRWWNRVLVLQQRTRAVQLEGRRGTQTLTKVCGETAGHRDGVQSRWNKPNALCIHWNTVFVCDTCNKAVRMLKSAKRLIALQSKMAQYANVFWLNMKAKEEDLYHVHLKIWNLSRSWLHISLTTNRKPRRGRASGIPTVPTWPYLDAPNSRSCGWPALPTR